MYDKLYCVTKNQPHIAYQFLYSSIFLSLQQKFLSQISQLLFESGSSNFVYTLRLAKYIVLQKIKLLMFIFPSFSIFLFFHLSLLCNADGDLLSKIFQQLLDLGLSNLVHRLGMTSCDV